MGASNSMKLLSVSLALVLTALLLGGTSASPPSPCDFAAIFNFGDSNSDTGGLSAAFGAAPPPNGETFFGKPMGRYCDGRLVVDFIGSVFISLLPKEEDFSRALYTFDIGQNDLTSGYFANQTTEEVLASIPDILSKFVMAIKSIYGEGGRFFWIHNTGPFGCLPYVLDRLPVTAAQVDTAGCAAPFNEVARAFNAQLKQTVALLRRDLPLAAFTYVDVYAAKYALISQPRKYGFKHPLVSCCGHGGKYNYNRQHGCGSEAVVNGTRVVLGRSCDRPSQRIIWDGVHYTEAANKWVFDLVAGGQLSDPPLPVAMACRRL